MRKIEIMVIRDLKTGFRRVISELNNDIYGKVNDYNIVVEYYNNIEEGLLFDEFTKALKSTIYTGIIDGIKIVDIRAYLDTLYESVESEVI